jgi:hypothetical protein
VKGRDGLWGRERMAMQWQKGCDSEFCTFLDAVLGVFFFFFFFWLRRGEGAVWNLLEDEESGFV